MVFNMLSGTLHPLQFYSRISVGNKTLNAHAPIVYIGKTQMKDQQMLINTTTQKSMALNIARWENIAEGESP